MFQNALQFKVVIVLCYSQQTTMRITSCVPPLLTWHIFQIIVDGGKWMKLPTPLE